jgi:fucose 4-O-acetylase-like acetyltransferase
METTKPRTVNSIGMFDMLKGAGMLAIVLGHTAELYPLQLEGGLSLTAFVGFIYRETLMAAFFIASGYGFRKRSISKCIHQQLKSLLKPFCYTAVFTTVLHFIIHYKTFHYLPGSMTESIKVAGGFLLGLPHTATYFGQEFFSCGPMWYLLALLMGWILLDVILNIFPERYIPWAVGGAALLGWGASLVWELPFCLIQGAVITPYLYLGYLAKRQHWLDQPLSRRVSCILWAAVLLIPAAALATRRTDCVSMAEWSLGPISILLDGLAGLLFIRLFLRWSQRRNPRGHRPPFSVHLLRTYGGADRHSVVSVRRQIRRPPCFGHQPAIHPFAGLHLADLRPAAAAAGSDHQVVPRPAAHPSGTLRPAALIFLNVLAAAVQLL